MHFIVDSRLSSTVIAKRCRIALIKHSIDRHVSLCFLTWSLFFVICFRFQFVCIDASEMTNDCNKESAKSFDFHLQYFHFRPVCDFHFAKMRFLSSIPHDRLMIVQNGRNAINFMADIFYSTILWHRIGFVRIIIENWDPVLRRSQHVSKWISDDREPSFTIECTCIIDVDRTVVRIDKFNRRNRILARLSHRPSDQQTN